MQIHVVRPGDTLWKLSQQYAVPLNTLITANEIPNPNRLVVGQTIVIPIWGSYHWVRPGESLYQISLMYKVPLQELIRINGIANPAMIPVGLRLYIPQTPRPTIDVGGYIDPEMTGAASPTVVDKIGKYLTYLNIFSYAANVDGSLTPLNDDAIIASARNHRISPLMVLTNFKDGTFSTEVATTILTNEELQNSILDNSLKVMEEKGYVGLDVDFEYLGAPNRERFNSFIRKAAARLHPKNYSLSTALAPKLSGEQKGLLYEGHDYKTQGEITDFIFFMTYEWGWSGGPPMAVSPIDQVRNVLKYVLTVVPKNKIMMGIPLYGYDWTLPYVQGGPWARTISPQEAIALAARYGSNIQYDPISQAPFFNYTDEQGQKHEVWFEDARSIQAKFDLVKELGIRGFFYWVLGRDFPQNWLLIEDNFVVKKLNI